MTRRHDRGEVQSVTEIPPPQGGGVRWFGVVLLLGHAALVATGAWSLWAIAGGWWLGALAAVPFVVGYVVLWRFLLAPGSRVRLGYKERLTVHLVLGPAVVVLGSLAHVWLPALVFVSVILLGDALDERARRR